MTFHGSKGLEFDFVWVAHLDENNVMKGKRRNFSLPQSVVSKIEEKDELAAKRELYVAITRAKRFCNLSYSRFSYGGQNQELAKIISDLLISSDICFMALLIDTPFITNIFTDSIALSSNSAFSARFVIC